MAIMFKPAIKWTGSKRSQAKNIVSKFPKEIDTYYEPFCGGASILRQLLDSDIKVNKYVCSDLNKDLISLWNTIKDSPDKIIEHYKSLWLDLVKLQDWGEKSNFYRDVRNRFNKSKNPLDFMFIMRTAVNGMPRYNKKGDFNTSFHLNRNGINPVSLGKTINEWSKLLNKNSVVFECNNYSNYQTSVNDILYLDPPYAGTKGMYFGGIDLKSFWDYLRLQKGKYYLSFDGKTNTKDSTFAVPEDIYSTHEYLPSGNSKFRATVNQTSNDTFVFESLYIK